MRDCPFCKEPWPDSEGLGVHGFNPLMSSFATEKPKYNVRDAIEFTTRNVGSLSVILQFLAGLFAAWRKPSVPR